MKLWVRTLWEKQPAFLRRVELDFARHALARPLDRKRPLLAGDVIVGGFMGTASGLGEGARRFLSYVQSIGVKAHAANVSRFAALEDFDAGPLWPQAAAPGGIAIFHVNPDLLNLTMSVIGRQRLLPRRLVGMWAWELDVLPPKWVRTLKCVDEIWVSSRFIADAVKKASPKSVVHVLPLPVDAAEQPMIPLRDPLPRFQGRPVVLFAFDVRSTMARKNPEAVIEAFRRATANDRNPVLVIKASNVPAWPEANERLARAIGGMENVHLIHDILTEDGMKDLIARADVVMSLHRSEGFGLLLASGMAAAKPVIATGWSGNVDFMPPDACALVPFRRVPVVDPQNAYNIAGATWADPDVDFAAKALRRLLDNPNERQRMGQAARRHVTQHFSLSRWKTLLPETFWQSLSDGARGEVSR